MSDVVSTALIAGGAAVLGAAVPTVTAALQARAESGKDKQQREFERDRSWEHYQIGLRLCYRKFLDNVAKARLEGKSIHRDDLPELRENYNEAYFAGDDKIAELLDKYWPATDRDAGRPPGGSDVRADLVNAMKEQTKRTRREQQRIDDDQIRRFEIDRSEGPANQPPQPRTDD
jgi:hypothetical protein